jgi:subtilisin family serine protease
MPHNIMLPPDWTTTIRWDETDVLVDRSRIRIQFNPVVFPNAAAIREAAELIQKSSPIRIYLHSVDRGSAVFTVETPVEVPHLLAELGKRLPSLFPAEGAAIPHPELVHKGFSGPNDTFADDWPYVKIRAVEAWRLEAGNNPDITIGVIDSGLSLRSKGAPHPDFKATRFHLGGNFVTDGAPAIDDNMHGTMVTGIVAAQRGNGEGIPGMTSETHVHVCKTLRSDLHGNESDFNLAAKEIVDRAVATSKKVVINYSAGGRRGSRELREACLYVQEQGMLLCVAAGEGDGVLQFPAAYSRTIPNVIAVGATHKDDTPMGPVNVDLFAPGAGVRSTTPAHLNNGDHYDSNSGTSLAAPFVTGLAALVWSRFPNLTAVEVKERMINTARMASRLPIIDAAAALA